MTDTDHPAGGEPGDDTPPHATTGRTNPHTAAQRRHMAQLGI